MPVPNYDDFDSDFAGPAQWAAMYRHYGLQVIPCRSPSGPGDNNWKRPQLAEWKTIQAELINDATFARWYDPATGEHRNRRNMGILTGAASGRVFVLDLDTHKNPQASLWWSGALAVHNNGMELETPTQRTGGGGLQLLFRAPAGWAPPTNRGENGVDTRGEGGFAVMPSSLHNSGAAYEWLPGLAPWEVPILEAPAWLCEEIDKLQPPRGASPGPRSERPDKPTSGGDFDGFGHRVDGREEAMRDMVWRVVVKLYRSNPTRPTGDHERQIMEAEYAIYERASGPKETQPGETRMQALEREGRGPTEWHRKWRRAMSQWDTDVRAAAAEPDPNPDPNEWMRDDLAGEFDQQPKVDPATGKPLPLLLSSSQFVAGFTPPEYLIDGVLQRGYLYSLTARTNHGKTAVSMYLAQCVARGEPVHGREVKTGTVLILAGENPDDIRARFLVLAEAYGFDPNTIKVRFIAGVVKLVERMAEIRAEAELIDDLVLVIVDTAAAYFPGADGNSNTEQGGYARLLRSLTTLRGRPCALVNCHPVKNASRENLLPMGGSAFVNEVDGNLTLWANGEKQTSLHWQGKFRGPEFEPLSFELRGADSPNVTDAKGRRMPSVVAYPISELTMEASEMTQESAENLLLNVMHGNPNASFSTLAIRCGFLHENRPQKSRVQRMIQQLVDDKLVAKHRGGKYRLTTKGRREIGVENDE